MVPVFVVRIDLNDAAVIAKILREIAGHLEEDGLIEGRAVGIKCDDSPCGFYGVRDQAKPRH